MCRLRPGPRCEDSTKNRLIKNERWIERTETELKEIEQELSETITHKRETALKNRQARLQLKLEERVEEKKMLELDYNRCPTGRASLEKRIEEEQDLDKKELLAVDLQVATQRRKWQNAKWKEYNKIEKSDEDGVEKAIEKAKEDKDIASRRADAIQTKKMMAEENLKKAMDLRPSQRRKLTIGRLRKTIHMLNIVHSFYKLMTSDLDEYVLNKTASLARKIGTKAIGQVVGAVASAASK